jgi:hypothetical protein
MKLPTFTLKPLLRLHTWAMRRPYFHLDGYMQRGWVLGYHSAARNAGNPTWHGRTLGRLHAWLTERAACRAHTILRSDHDRARHDHPVNSISVVLDGGYWEVCEPPEAGVRFPEFYGRLLHFVPFAQPADRELLAAFGIHWRGPGAVVYRRAEASHRLVIPVGGTPARTLWIVGRKRRSWGFITPEGWKSWRQYLGVDGGSGA